MVESRVRTYADRARMRLFRLHLDLGLPLPAYLREIPVRTAYNYAKLGYRPATAFDGESLLMRATTGVGNDEAYVNRYVNPQMGWGPRTTRPVRVVDVPGGHSTMLQEPNARALAEHLQNYVNETVGRAGPAEARDPAVVGEGTGDPRPAPEVEGDAPGRADSGPSRPSQLLVVSAASREALDDAAERLAGPLAGRAEADLPDVAYTLAVGRPESEWRRAAVGGAREELADRLRKGTGRGAGPARIARRGGRWRSSWPG